MKIVIAMDSFKGSLTSVEAGKAVQAGILRVFPDAEARIFPLADGGEGTVEALIRGLGGSERFVTVSDSIGRAVTARYGILPDQTAVIEMAAASGLPLLSESERNPMHTTTFGFGEMIADAVRSGCKKLILGIGGSATNDGGTGCMQALGFQFLDNEGKNIPCGAAGLNQLCRIDSGQVHLPLRACRFYTACDVTNPLCGDQGCSIVFGPQKGADSRMTAVMDQYMHHYAEITKKHFPHADPDASGAGAAGGLGFALRTFLGAELIPGIELVIRQTGLSNEIQSADLVVTGEGCMDAQTAYGKAPAGVAAAAKEHGVPVIAFSGIVRDGAEACNSIGIESYFPILRSTISAKAAMEPETASKNLTEAVEQAFRLIRCAKSISMG